MKNKKILIITLLFVSFILSACEYRGPTSDVTDSYDLSNDFFLYEIDDESFDLVKNPSDEDPKPILENVSKIAFNDNFILAGQIEIIQLGKEEKEVYWIINSTKGKIYGPMEYKEFETQRKELNIDESLKLKNPDKYIK